MRLHDLDACFLSNATEHSFHEQESIDGAQGVMFECPLCHRHQVICWFRNPRNASPVPASMEPGPGRWEMTGDTPDNLTLNPSVNLDTPGAAEAKKLYPNTCLWHGWVKNGDAT